ncbi:exopolyphosphatase [Methanobrevibacter sp.]|uniref:Ppx/GppA phosphatase family protein n=1 Tax=Methanobrevibacter sp. TaxID=66852 RepID=UPI00388CF766
MKRYGIVDIGSNTIRFKIYDYMNGKVRHSVSNKKTAGLIGFRENGKLNEAGIHVLVSTLKKFNRHMEELGVDEAYYFATASLRNVDNTEEILDRVKKALNIHIHVLSPDDEATLSFEIIKEKDLYGNDGILIDVGGGSSEINVFKNRKPIGDVSLPIGSLVMYQEYVSLMFPDENERKHIQKRVLKEIKDSGIKKHNREIMIGVGGTVRSIKRLLKYLGMIEHHTKIIPIYLLDDLLNELRHNTKEDYNKVLQIKAERIHTLIPGIIIVKTIADYFDVKYLHVTNYSIREGVLNSIINGEFKSPGNIIFK